MTRKTVVETVGDLVQIERADLADGNATYNVLLLVNSKETPRIRLLTSGGLPGARRIAQLLADRACGIEVA